MSKKSQSTTRIFSKKFLVETLDLPYAGIERELVELQRWSAVYRLVFEYEGKYYACNYSEGLTELQYQAPFEDDPEWIECKEVKKRMVKVEKWVEI